MAKQVRRSFDFLPLTIRLETRGGVGTPLVLRGTPLPTKRSQQFSTADDNQAEVATKKIAMGESPVFKNNLALGELHLQGIPAAKKGVPSIKVEFAVDKTCSVVATATVAVTQPLFCPFATCLSTAMHKKRYRLAQCLTRAGCNPSPIDLSAITQRNEIESVSLPVEFVDHAVIADPKPKLRAAGQMAVREIVEARAELMIFLSIASRTRGGNLKKTESNSRA